MWLRVKIFTGYLVLIALLAFTVFLLRGEQQKRSRLQTDEAELLHAWQNKPMPDCWNLPPGQRPSASGTRKTWQATGTNARRSAVPSRNWDRISVPPPDKPASTRSACSLNKKSNCWTASRRHSTTCRGSAKSSAGKFRSSSPMSGRPPPRLPHPRIPSGNRPRPAYGPGSSSGKKRNRPIWSSGKRRKKDPVKRDKRDKARRPPACSVP